MASFVASDPSALLRLCASLNDQSAINLQFKINRYLEEQTGAGVSFLIPTESDEDDEKVGDDCAMFVQVVGQDTRNSPIKFESAEFKSVLEDHKPLHLSELSPPQVSYVEKLVGQKISTFVAIPISPHDEKTSRNNHHSSSSTRVQLIACLANKQNGFQDCDILKVKECFQVSLGVLMNTLAYEEEKRIKDQCQSLLTVARNLFTHLDDVTVLLRQIMSEARQLTQAERCSLFLLDHKQNELIAKVFDGDIPEKSSPSFENGREVRIPISSGIAGHVALSGELLNIRDAQSHPLFYNTIDKETGFKTRNILCFPIKDDRHVIGVAELCNKTVGTHFTKFDEEIAMAFSAYCGISIIHSLMYKKVADAQHRSKLSNELMMYHMKVADEDVSKLVLQHIPAIDSIHPEFSHFSFIPRNLEITETPAAVFAMIQHMGMVSRWRIPRETLARFILMVRRGYRDPPYHNWTHAFSVAHYCFLLLNNLKLIEQNKISELEGLALMVACLCHDLDHRGTNSQFQLASNSVLAALYSSEGSVMERHHFAQTMCILNTEGCNILENLAEKDYTRCLDLLRDIILATDLAHHLRIHSELEVMASRGYDPSDEGHHALLLCLLMTSCDLSDQAKDWTHSKNIAELIYSEFFSQGDLEKAMGNKPQEMMDRERACIPSLQLGFIDHIALPVYKLLDEMFPELDHSYSSVLRNRAYWARAHEALQRRGRNGTGNVKDIFRDESIEREVQKSDVEEVDEVSE